MTSPSPLSHCPAWSCHTDTPLAMAAGYPRGSLCPFNIHFGILQGPGCETGRLFLVWKLTADGIDPHVPIPAVFVFPNSATKCKAQNTARTLRMEPGSPLFWFQLQLGCRAWFIAKPLLSLHLFPELIKGKGAITFTRTSFVRIKVWRKY